MPTMVRPRLWQRAWRSVCSGNAGEGRRVEVAFAADSLIDRESTRNCAGMGCFGERTQGVSYFA